MCGLLPAIGTRSDAQSSTTRRTAPQDPTMPRAYWNGYLRMSLVTCPIELFPATSQAEKTHFHQINTQTGHRLRQQMVDEETGRVVDAEHRGRGYELTKGKYVEIDEDELKAIQVESTHTVDIDGFVPRADIDKRYLDTPYYIARPERQERKPSLSFATPCTTKSVLRLRAS
jgi:Ku protein